MLSLLDRRLVDFKLYSGSRNRNETSPGSSGFEAIRSGGAAISEIVGSRSWTSDENKRISSTRVASAKC